MSTHNLKLLKFPGNYNSESGLLYGPKAYIAVKISQPVELNDKNQNKISSEVLSPECLSLSEINYEIERLIKELQTLKKDAKKFFQKEKQNENKLRA